MKNKKQLFVTSMILLLAFAAWTIIIQTVDVQATGISGTNIGPASVNTWFHRLTGVHGSASFITDRLGPVPIFVCVVFEIRPK